MAKKKVTKKRFTNLIIIDASGSMASKLEEVKGGIRQLFKNIREDAVKNPEINSTTIVVDFSSAKDFNVLVNSSNVDSLLDSIADKYTTRGMTALFDAIGTSFRMVPTDQDGVFITVITDGAENDSKEFTADSVRSLISNAKTNKWAVTFMGADENAMLAAKNIGISTGNSLFVSNDSFGIKKGFAASSLSRTAYYTSVVTDTSIDLENLIDPNSK